MEHPIPFITLTEESQKAKKEGKDDPKRKFVLHEDAAKIIESITQPKIAVITIAGLYRTGKSFILNKMAGQTHGFDIGSTIEPCTQGIWMWLVDPKKVHPSFPKDTAVLLLDTEGLGSYTKSKTYDIQIFSLAVLLSSYFIYNSTGSIDETAIDRLSLVVELTKHIKAHADSDVEAPAELNTFFPKFLWLVRDFALKLQSNGRDISPKEYLENSLAPIPGDAAKVKDKNLIRTSITQFFVDRTCFTLKRPVNDEKLLQHLETAKEEDFRPQFLEELHQLLDLIFNYAKPKKLYHEALNGAMFVHLARNYIQAINVGSVPTIRTAWENVVEIENQKALAEAFRIYEQAFEEYFKNNAILEVAQMDAAHASSLEKALEKFRSMVKGDSHVAYEKKLMNQVNDVLKRKRELNLQNSQKLCDSILEEIVNAINLKIEDGSVVDMDALSKLWNDSLDGNYDKNAKGPKKEACLATFLRRKPIEQSRKVMLQICKKLQQKHEEEIEEMKKETAKEVGRIEKLYTSVLESWDRTKSELKTVEEENLALIKSIAHLSEAL